MLTLLDKADLMYFDWLCDFTEDRYHFGDCYTKLLMCLHDVEFRYLIPLDENRALDGIDLRWRFACDMGWQGQWRDVRDILQGPCSVLEMMVALACRCEDTIMTNPDIGSRTSFWFWMMIDNLGLTDMDNDKFDINEVMYKLNIFLDREHEPNGKGGLFYIENPRRDLREVEIWYQMCWYLCSIDD